MTEARQASGYSRPHELEVSRADEGGGLWATVSDVRIVGRDREDRSHGRRTPSDPGRAGTRTVTKVRVIVGEPVYVKPRRVRVFMEDGK